MATTRTNLIFSAAQNIQVVKKKSKQKIQLVVWGVPTDLIGPGDDLIVDVRDVHAKRPVVAEEIRHHAPKDVEMKVRPRWSSRVKWGQVR